MDGNFYIVIMVCLDAQFMLTHQYDNSYDFKTAWYFWKGEANINVRFSEKTLNLLSVETRLRRTSPILF